MNFVSGETAEMAAQETLHGHHNVHYAQNDPAAPNSYNYHFGMHPDEGPFPGHYNSYVGQQQSHYGEAMMQHHGEPYENMGHHSNYQSQGSNFNNDAHMHYAQSHASMQHNGNPYGQHHMMDNMQHNPHYLGMMPPGGFKEEPKDDPYSFVDEEQMMHQESLAMMPGNIKTEPGMGMNPLLGPKKRGRKKKNSSDVEEGNMNPLPLTPDGSLMKRKYTKSEHYKQRRKHDRFNGMSEEEVRTRTLPDHLIPNLDVVIIGINPGLFAAYKGHHYAGPGNHFWKCMFLAGLVPEPMTADDDYKLLHYGIGFTNMVARATKGSADLTRREIRDGVKILLEKLQRYRPKVAVFNGKGIYEVFSGKKEFLFGRQPEFIDGTNTYIWVMPSSSARCAQLPRAMDKVPFYTALKKFRDYLNGLIPSIDDSEVVFNDPKIRAADDGTEISEHLKYDTPTRQLYSLEAPAKDTNSVDVPQISDSNGQPVVAKKKRGRPKKIRTEEGNIPKAEFSASSSCSTQPYPLPGGEIPLDGPPKKKRGRPKKIRPEEQMKTNPGPMGEVPAMVSHQSEMVNTHTPGPYHHPINQDSYMNPQSQVGTPSFCNGSSATPSPVHGSMATTEQCVGSSQPSISSPMTNQEFEGVSNPGEPGSVNTAATVPVTPSTTTATTPMSTALGPSSASSQNESCNETANSDRENFTQYHSNNTNPQTPSNTPGATGASEQPQQQQQQQQQHDQPPANYRPPTSSGPGYPVHNQDIAARSLSGLESLVDQIPNMGSDEHGQISGHAHGLAYGSQYAPPPSSYSGPYPVTGNYAQYTGAYSGGGPGSGPGFAYSSGSHAPMEPHYSNPAAPYPHLVPGGAMFPPGANMNGMPGFPYSYNQYPPAGPQSSSFPYSSPVQNPGYPYPATSSAYGHPYPQPGYFNNQVLDRLKQQPDPRDMNYGGF